MDTAHEHERHCHEDKAEYEERGVSEEVYRSACYRRRDDRGKLREEVICSGIDTDRLVISHLPEHRERIRDDSHPEDPEEEEKRPE